MKITLKVIFILLLSSVDVLSQKPKRDSLFSIDQKSKVLIKSDDFSGHFKEVLGNINLNLDLNSLQALDLFLNVNSLELEIPGMTKHALSADYFNATQYPLIRFTGRVYQLPSGELFAEGIMNAKGKDRFMKIALTLEETSQSNTKLLKATFPIKRTDFDIGDETSVSNDVKIEASIYFKVKK